MSHPADVVAKVKGAYMAGLSLKRIAHITSLPLPTIEQWTCKRHKRVEPNRELEDMIRRWLNAPKMP